MQGQRPRPNEFISNVCSSSKQTPTKHILHPLPQSQQPTPSHPVQFYKTRYRQTSQMFSTHIGYRMRQYSRVQQDYIVYLTQLIAMECSGIKIYVVEPNYLYFQVSMLAEEGEVLEGDKDKERQEIELENGMFAFLKHVSENVFNPWVDANLDATRLMSQDFSQQKIIETFTKQVVENIKKKHSEVFEKRKKTNS